MHFQNQDRIRENNLKYVSKWSDKCLFYRFIDLFTNHCHVNINADKICMVMFCCWYKLRSVALKNDICHQILFPSTASWLGGTFKTKKANNLMHFIYNLTKGWTNWQEKKNIMYSKGIAPIFVKIVAWQICFFCMETATDTELLYHLHALVRKYGRHLQDASMLAELNKDDVII